MTKVIFDFDGTIVDIADKYRYVFGSITGLDYQSQEVFWNAKKSGVDVSEILQLFPEIKFSKGEFLRLWRSKIETVEALAHDVLQPQSLDVLDRLSRRMEVFLCTARQNDLMLNDELNTLRITKYFSAVLVTKQTSSKFDTIKKFLTERDINLNKSDWIVGDTLEDILTGQGLNIQTCGVLSGLTPRKEFESMALLPNLVVQEIFEFAHRVC